MDLKTIDAKFSILDRVPDALYSDIVTHTHGDLIPRVTAILHWRECMLNGRIPEEFDLDWPEATIRRTILMRLETLQIVQYCKDQETLTDSVLKDILEGISSAEAYFSLKPGGFVDKLTQRQKFNQEESSFKDEEGLADHVEQSNGSVELSENHSDNQSQSSHVSSSSDSNRLLESTTPISEQNFGGSPSVSENYTVSQVRSQQTEFSEQASVAQIEKEETSQVIEDRVNAIIMEQVDHNWQELVASWDELSSTFTELGGLLGRGWDLTQGVLASQGWRDIIRYRKLIKQLPELQKIVATLGRLRTVTGEDRKATVSEQVFNPINRQIIEEQETWTDKAAMETGGIVLSDDISRLLPSELALLGHPKLKMLWYAKRAERKLLTYCHCGLMPDPMIVDKEVEIEGLIKQDNSSQAYGPIIICLDTSGSMHGEPEAIAKALTLEALRIAYHERRACYVYCFSGVEQVVEHELDLTQGGLGKLLEFLQQSFHGGTDVVKPLLMALEKQKTEQWEKADILLISDGRFPIQPELFQQAKRAKKAQKCRIHGVLLGSWRSKAIEELCEPLHCLSEWV